MSSSEFLRTLQQELGDSPKAKRYVRELSEHLEDAQAHGSNSSSEKSDPAASLGSPRELREHFHAYVRGATFWNTFSQSLLVGILSMPLYLAMIMILSTTAIQYLPFRGGEWNIGLLYLLVALGVLALFVGLLYWRALPAVFRFIPGWKAHRGWIALMTLPTLIPLVISWFPVEQPFQNIGISLFSDPVFLIDIAASVLVIWYGSIMFRWAVKDLRRESRVISVGSRRKTLIVAIVSTIYLLVTQVIVWLPVWMNQPPFYSSPSLMGFAGLLIMLPRTIVEYIFAFLPSVFIHLGSIRLAYGLVPGILVVLGGIIVYQLIDAIRHSRTRPFPWLRCVILIYLILLLGASPAWSPKLEIAVPFTNLTEVIDNKEFGPIHRFVRYLGSYDETFLYYSVLQRESVFRFEQPFGFNYQLSSIHSTNNYQLVRSPSLTDTDRMDFSFLEQGSRHGIKDLSCLIKESGEQDLELMRCDVLTYRGQPIVFNPQNPQEIIGWISGVGITEDQRFLVIELRGNKALSIYLLDLSSIQ